MEAEQKPVTTEEKFRERYGALAMKAGDIQYKIKCFEQELHETNEAIARLNQEVMAAQQAAAVEATNG